MWSLRNFVNLVSIERFKPMCAKLMNLFNRLFGSDPTSVTADVPNLNPEVMALDVELKTAEKEFNKCTDAILYISNKVAAAYLYGVLDISDPEDPFDFDQTIIDANKRLASMGIDQELVVTKNGLMFNKAIKLAFEALLEKKAAALIKVRDLREQKAKYLSTQRS